MSGWVGVDDIEVLVGPHTAEVVPEEDPVVYSSSYASRRVKCPLGLAAF